MADRIGQQFGNYRPIRLLGQGSFAQVYLGEHVHLGTSAAIKILQAPPGYISQEDFRNEAHLLARLDHPHIESILDFGVEDTTFYLASVAGISDCAIIRAVQSRNLSPVPSV